MAALMLSPVSGRIGLARATASRYSPCVSRRTYSASRRAQPTALHLPARRLFSQQPPKRPKPSGKIEWYPIPIGLGIGFLGLVQFYKIYSREKEPEDGEDGEPGSKPKKRPRIRPEGPWYGPLFLGIGVEHAYCRADADSGP